MRYKTYFRRIISTGQVEELRFSHDDRGLTHEAALAQVNEWNRLAQNGNYQYWIE